MTKKPTHTKDATYLGFDFGTKRIGVAVGQSITASAQPLKTLKACEGEPQWEAMDSLITQWKPCGLIVGIPLNMDGTEQPITQQARLFIQALTARYHLPVYESDERLSTREAKALLFEEGGYNSLKNKAIDSYAAQIILATWLNSPDQ